jgi:hypothetical protein
MALQVYHTYTSVDLRYFVQWHSDVWVPQQMRVIKDELLSDDVLGNFLHDVWELKRKDPNREFKQRRVGASLSHQVLRK